MRQMQAYPGNATSAPPPAADSKAPHPGSRLIPTAWPETGAFFYPGEMRGEMRGQYTYFFLGRNRYTVPVFLFRHAQREARGERGFFLDRKAQFINVIH